MNKLYYTTVCNGSEQVVDSYYKTKKEAKQAVKDLYNWLSADEIFSKSSYKLKVDYKHVRINNFKRNTSSFVALLNTLNKLPRYSLPTELTIK